MNDNFKISDENFDLLVETICSRLSQGKRVRRNLPGGRIHIDRPLPFLCVYRQPPHYKDEGTERLIMGEAAYLIVTGDPKFHANIEKLLHSVIKTLSAQFGAFLMLEIWPAPQGAWKLFKESPHKPAFRVLTEDPEYSSFTPMLSNFENFLKKIRILKVSSVVEMCYATNLAPRHMPSLIKKSIAKEYRCHMVGLEVKPIYQSKKIGEHFPLVLQNLHRGVSKALKQLCFDFIQAHTSQHPSNYQALGRRAVVKAVWEIDSKLAEVNNAFDFLLLITPVNADLAWEHFKNDKFQKVPEFYYRPLPVDPAVVKRKLFDIPIERIEDPTLAYLFREKQSELAHRLNMLTDRGTKRFLFSNLQLYGEVDAHLTYLAQKILKTIPARNRKDSSIKADEFLHRVNLEINYYKRKYAKFKAMAKIDESIPGVLVLKGNVYIGKNAKVSAARINALIHHEVGTHLVTYFNGRVQPFKQLYSGLAGYEELQEGLAILAEYFSGEFTAPRLRTIAARVIAAKCLIDGKNFVDTFHVLIEKYRFDYNRAFRITFRTYRSGGSIKDIIYLRGLQKIMEYIREGGSLDPLFVGKFGFDHIPIIKELIAREIVRLPVVQPRFLTLPGTSEKLAKIRRGSTINKLIER